MHPPNDDSHDGGEPKETFQNFANCMTDARFKAAYILDRLEDNTSRQFRTTRMQKGRAG